MAKASYYPTGYDASPAWINPSNVYDDGLIVENGTTYLSASIGAFTSATRHLYANTFNIIGTGNGQIPSGTTINSVLSEGQGRTSGAGSVGVQPYVDGVLRNAITGTSSTSSSPLPKFNSGAQVYRNATTAWTTDDLDNTSFKMDVIYNRSSGLGTQYGFIDYTRVEVDYQANTTIDVGTASSATGTGSSYSGSHSTSGSNRGLIVAIYTNSASTTFSSVTYNSVSMTQKSLVQAQGYSVAVYSLSNPTTGSNTLAVTFGQSNTYRIISQPLTGVNQADCVEAQNTGNDNTTNPVSISVTSSSNNAYIFNATALTDPYYMMEKTGQGRVLAYDEGSWQTGLSYKVAWTAGSVATGWYADAETNTITWAGAAVAIKPYSPYKPKIMMVS